MSPNSSGIGLPGANRESAVWTKEEAHALAAGLFLIVPGLAGPGESDFLYIFLRNSHLSIGA